MQMGWLLTKDSPLLPSLNHGLTRLRQSGSLDRLMLRHHHAQQRRASATEPSPLGPGQAVLAFAVGAAIVAVTGVIWAAELAWAKLGW